METARRLGVFALVLAFILYLFFDRSENTGLAWRGQLLVYSFFLGLLGIFLLSRYRSRGHQSSRFSGLKDFLFRSGAKKPRRRGGRRSRKRRREREDEETVEEKD